MAKLAGYLCATVEFPKPHLMLDTMHINHNKRISVNSTWNDYFFNFTFYQDSPPAVYDLADDLLFHPRTKNNTAYEMYAEENCKDCLRDIQTVEGFSR
jgi:hypothetical protein